MEQAEADIEAVREKREQLRRHLDVFPGAAERVPY